MIALDTNLLVYAHFANSPEHEAAARALEAARRSRRGWGVAFPAVAEFWRVTTHPSVAPTWDAPRAAAEFLTELWKAGAVCWLPLMGFERRLIEEAGRLGVRGARVCDLQIALISREAGADQVWTHDRGFLPLAGLAVMDPLA